MGLRWKVIIMAYLEYVLLAVMGASTTAVSLPRVLDEGAINQPRGGAGPEFSHSALFGQNTGGDKAGKNGKKPTHYRRHRRHRYPNAITVKQT